MTGLVWALYCLLRNVMFDVISDGIFKKLMKIVTITCFIVPSLKAYIVLASPSQIGTSE